MIPFYRMTSTTPRYMQETVLNICIVIGAIGGIIGLVFLFVKGFADKDAWICFVSGAAVFFGFLRVKSIEAGHREERQRQEEDIE